MRDDLAESAVQQRIQEALESREWEGYANVRLFAPNYETLMGFGFHIMLQNYNFGLRKWVVQIDLGSFGAPYAMFQLTFDSEEELNYFYRAAPKLKDSIDMVYLPTVMG